MNIVIGGRRSVGPMCEEQLLQHSYYLFALDCFTVPDSRDDVRNGSTDELNLEKFDDGLVYSTHTTFQYKAMLYHSSIFTTR
jgi:hypothetical protein